jgi:hypothetical protein
LKRSERREHLEGELEQTYFIKTLFGYYPFNSSITLGYLVPVLFSFKLFKLSATVHLFAKEFSGSLCTYCKHSDDTREQQQTNNI